MNYPKYNFSSSSKNTTFTFTSTGRNGKIAKIIRYECIDNTENIYNICFGNHVIDADGNIVIDDLDISDNGDRDKILATVTSSIYIFTESYPDKNVFLKGSTESRTRLYRMAISKEYDNLSIKFEILGAILDNEGFVNFIKFENNQNYYGFLIIPKTNENS